MLTRSSRTRNFAARIRAVGRSRGAPEDAIQTTRRAEIFRTRSMKRLILVRLALSFLSRLASAQALDDIPPPFGFNWNDSTGRVETSAQRREGEDRHAREKRETRVWTVEGLGAARFQRTLFTFREGFLVEVELQYEYPDWTIERYNERMGEIRRYFDAKFGTGKLVSRSRDTDTDVIQTLVGYQWMVGGTMLELFYFSAQRDALLFRTITVDLQNDLIGERRSRYAICNAVNSAQRSLSAFASIGSPGSLSPPSSSDR